jgi:homogentisate 1,2-dioxygenase
MRTMTTAGDAGTQAGMAAHVYLFTKSMVDRIFLQCRWRMMFVPQQGNIASSPNSASSMPSPARSA